MPRGSAVWDGLDRSATEKRNAVGVDLGGGGDYRLLYFLERACSPRTVVERGVAAGFSSQALLKALAVNDAGGRLLSSDFPYFRLESPERFVGLVVDEALKPNWELFLDGDRTSIPAILGRVESIDFVRYDSDKMYEGREFVMTALEPKLSEGAIIVIDDIHDNLFFRDYVSQMELAHRVFHFGGKFLGAIGV